MEDMAHTVHGLCHRLHVAHVAHDDAAIDAFDILPRTGFAHEHAHIIAARHKRTGHGRSDKARRTGDENAVAHHPSAALVRARRPSITCQARSTGTPMTMSRARRKSDTASPTSGPSPNSGMSAA